MNKILVFPLLSFFISHPLAVYSSDLHSKNVFLTVNITNNILSQSLPQYLDCSNYRNESQMTSFDYSPSSNIKKIWSDGTTATVTITPTAGSWFKSAQTHLIIECNAGDQRIANIHIYVTWKYLGHDLSKSFYKVSLKTNLPINFYPTETEGFYSRYTPVANITFD